MNPFSNKFLFGATMVVISLQMFAVYNPFMQKILHTTPLSLSEWHKKLLSRSLLQLSLVEEIRKLVYRRRVNLKIYELA